MPLKVKQIVKTDYCSFIKIHPEEAINLDFEESLKYLEVLIGKGRLNKAFTCHENYPSPVSHFNNGEWLKKVKMIEINPRMCNTFWGIVKYAMTFPEDAIHLLPLWTAGCDGSLYSPVNWELNSELIDNNLCKLGFDTPEKQLKLVVNILHSMGKTVAFDVLLHTDRFSEIVFAQPHFFEWIKLNKDKTYQLEYPEISLNELHLGVQEIVIEYLKQKGDSFDKAISEDLLKDFFSKNISEKQRLEILFGNEANRTQRRIELIDFVRNEGYETIPVTENKPSRPVVFDKIENDQHANWATFKIKQYNPEDNTYFYTKEHIFGSITPYKWYKIDNEGYPIAEEPIQEVWDYFIDKIVDIQKEFNFDFIRADMGHIQLAHCHKNPQKNENNKAEIWAYIKDEIQKNVPYFGTFVESFLSDYSYISVFQDLENKKFDTAMGFLHYFYIDRNYFNFIEDFMALDRSFKISISTMAHDSDTLEHNYLYKSPKANEIRMFTALFTNLPSYTGMGIETRNLEPLISEEYAANFIKYQPSKYTWGNNLVFLKSLIKMRELYSQIKPVIENQEHRWIETDNPKHIAWAFYDKGLPTYLFLLNIDTDFDNNEIKIQNLTDREYHLTRILTNSDEPDIIINQISSDGEVNIENVTIGDFCVYKVQVSNEDFDLKNDNQILVMSLECAPYIKLGGLADANCDFTKALKENFPQYDIRTMIPLFNASSREDINIRGFDVEYTGVSSEYCYGVSKSTAYLYKIKKPYNNIPVYLVYSDAFSHYSTPYVGRFKEIGLSSAFSNACISLLKTSEIYSKENLSPKIFHVTDWHISIDKKKDSFFKNSAVVHVLHNIGHIYQGWTEPFFALLNNFDTREINKFLNDSDVKQSLDNLVTLNSAIIGSQPRSDMGLLKVIEEKYLELLLPSNEEVLNSIRSLVVNLFPQKSWDDEYFYNPLKRSVEESDFWITDSETYFQEVVSSNKFSKSLFFTIKNSSQKGIGIMAGIDPVRFNPVDNKDIKFHYSVKNYFEGKAKNKKYFQNIFSNNLKDSFLFSEKSKIVGSLSVNPDAPLLLLSSRLDSFQKGIDIFLKIIPRILSKYNDCQIILAGPNFLDKENSIIYKHYKKVLSNINYKNRLVIVDDFIPIEQYLASADIFIMPSRYEPCGFSQLIAMRMGAVPIVSNTGGLRDTITSLLQNELLATGFKTQNSIMESKFPEEELFYEIESALECYYNNKECWNNLIKNCMKYDCSWNKTKIQKYVEVYKTLGLR